MNYKRTKALIKMQLGEAYKEGWSNALEKKVGSFNNERVEIILAFIQKELDRQKPKGCTNCAIRYGKWVSAKCLACGQIFKNEEKWSKHLLECEKITY